MISIYKDKKFLIMYNAKPILKRAILHLFSKRLKTEF